MNLVATKHVSIEKVEHFLQQNRDVNGNALMQHGYVVEIEQQIEGCFILEPMEPGVYWLKQLHVTKKCAPSLAVLLESVLAIAKQRHAKSVYVHSHQPVVDLLLDALQFHPQKKNEFVDSQQMKEGNWWVYNVSKMSYSQDRVDNTNISC
ncbi:hypothetical protein [Lentibacillus daqui]|uniref:hypothetical protein n=1 Tax=Lentibacillus daqui TaxID=2911514 RepID=UPI0022B0FDD1|nr:hypothetical protein [Lentibacillus daqui]